MKDMKTSTELDKIIENACFEIKKGTFQAIGSGKNSDVIAYGAGDKRSSQCEEENIII
jgi:hypothetical protein